MPADTKHKPRPTRSGLKVLAIGLAFFGLPILYVLGLGPATWLYGKGWMSDLQYDAAYTPLLKVAQRNQFLHKCYLNYVGWWTPGVSQSDWQGYPPLGE